MGYTLKRATITFKCFVCYCIDYVYLQRFSYLLCAAALARLGEQFDGGRTLGHWCIIIAILLWVIFRRAADGLLAWRRRCAGGSLPLEQGLIFAALATAHIYRKAQTEVMSEL